MTAVVGRLPVRAGGYDPSGRTNLVETPSNQPIRVIPRAERLYLQITNVVGPPFDVRQTFSTD
jgi:hypothetical protein